MATQLFKTPPSEKEDYVKTALPKTLQTLYQNVVKNNYRPYVFIRPKVAFFLELAEGAGAEDESSEEDDAASAESIEF